MQFMKHYWQKFHLLQQFIRKDDPVILEIGAHYGEDSMRFAETFSKARIYCFEPDPRNIAVFKKYINHPRIKLFDVALFDESGEKEFYQSYDGETTSHVPSKYDWISAQDYADNKLSNSGSSSIKRGYHKVLSGSVTVKTMRYDEWALENNIGPVDLVWIDVQGAEREVIEGMGSKIKDIKYLWIEYGEEAYEGGMNKSETIEFMNKKGFKVKVEAPNGPHAKTGDLLFVRL